MEQKKERITKIFMILSGLLFLTSGVLGYLLYNQKVITKTIIVEKEKLVNDYSNVKADLTDVTKLYDELKTNNVQLQQELDAKKVELSDLASKLERYKNDAYMIQKLKKELETIRNLIKSYLHDIDSLQQLNVGLHEEIAGVKKNLSEEKGKNQVTNDEVKRLNQKIELGSQLKAIELQVDALKERGSTDIVVTRAKKAKKIRATFKISENKIAKKGDRTIYMKVITPDGQTIANGTEEENMFMLNGEKQFFSAKKDVAYDNKDVLIHMYFTKKEDFTKGKHKIELYTEGVLIGTHAIELK
jgi:hypothetical protein